MSLEMITWALRLDLKSTRFQVMIALANEANSEGYIFTGTDKLVWYSNVSLRTFRTVMAEFKDMDLLHTERRYRDFGDGREADTICLHYWNTENFKPNYPGAEASRQYAQKSRERFEIPTEDYGRKYNREPVDNSPQTLSAKFALNGKTAGQTESAKFAPNPSPAPAKAELSAKTAPAKCKNEHLAFNRTARAFNPINPETDKSISQSENLSTPAVDKRQTEGSSEIKIHRGVNLAQLRQRLLVRTGREFTDDLLSEMLDIIFNRAHHANIRIDSPLAYCASSIAKAPDEFISQVLSAREAELAESVIEHQQDSAQISQPKQRKWCEHHYREYTAPQCPVCANPRIANLPGEPNYHHLVN